MWNRDRMRRLCSNAIGYLCILMFFSMTTYTVFIFYSQIGPSMLKDKAYGNFLFHFLFGNWLAINIYFNYIMAWLTSPGLSKNYQQLSIQYPVCKKCLYNKSPRTHHCNWCDSCVLRYDHHSPWLNNCVGFYNHRYFYQFCCFMSLGCLYAGWFGFREYQISLLELQLFRHIDSFLMAREILATLGIVGFITCYIFLVAFVMGFILLFLVGHHGRLIGRNMTIVEYLIDQNRTQHDCEQGPAIAEPHHINLVQNWKRFLGVRNIREFIRRILFPSTHKPRGNGIALDDYATNMDFNVYRKNSDVMRLPASQSVSEVSFMNNQKADYLLWLKESVPNGLSPYYRAPTPATDWQDGLKLSGV